MRYFLNLFDLDGTLVDSHRAICTAFNQMLLELELPQWDIQKMKKLIGVPLDETFRIFGVPDYEEAYAIYRKYYFPIIDTYQNLYPGVKTTLARLKNHVLMAVVTSKSREGAERSLQTFGIREYFDLIVSENEVGKLLKPHPLSLDHVLDFYRSQGKTFEKEDIIMTGDSRFDIEFAQNAEIDSAFASWGYTELEELPAKPTYVLRKIEDLILINAIDKPVEIEITPELDLHAFQASETKLLVENYLAAARKKGFKTVRIVHGKGKGVQKEMVQAILTKTTFIIRFYDAPIYNGHFGATIAELDVK